MDLVLTDSEVDLQELEQLEKLELARILAPGREIAVFNLILVRFLSK